LPPNYLLDAGERAENGVTSCRTRRRYTKSRV